MQGEYKEIIKEFLKEAEGHLQTVEQKALAVGTCLEQRGEFPAGDLGQMFQAVHTVKSTASLIGLEKTVALTHEFGTLLRDICDRKIALTSGAVGIFAVALEAFKVLVKGLKEKGQEVADIGMALDRMKEFRSAQASAAPEDKWGELSSQMPEIDEKYLEVYLDDTEQNIEHFNQDLVALEKNPTDMELINNLFRLTHTIKGSSGMVNVPQVQKVAHAMESILAVVRDKREALADMFAPLFEGIDTINDLVGSLRKKEPFSRDITPVVKKLTEYIGGLSSGIAKERAAVGGAAQGRRDLLEMVGESKSSMEILAQAIDQKNKIYKILLSIEAITPIKSMKAMLIERHLGNKGTIVLMAPCPEEIDDSIKGDLEVQVLLATFIDEKDISSLVLIGEVNFISAEQIKTKDIKELLSKIEESSLAQEEVKKDEAERKEAGPVAASVQAATIRIDAHKLDTLMNLSGELVTVRAQFERLVTLLNDEISSQRDFWRSISNVKSSFSGLTRDLRGLIIQRDEQNIKRVLKQFDLLNINLEYLEQLTSHSSLISEIHAIDETTGSLGKIASDIQAAVMQARMVPIKGVFTRFNRIVRDIAKDIGKDVNLILEGEETELDKNLVDSLGEPLTHMIRNAMDHGIENVKTRQKLGKPEKGTILLRASHEGNNICIEVMDDGKGLDPDMLAKSALKKKLITEEQMNRLTEREKLDLMFLPGFSTATEVTNLSGRGVGMDVVRNMILALNGDIDIISEIGKGTTFVLKIPLTLAIIQALMVVIDGGIYAIPLDAVTEIIKVSKGMIYSIDGNDTVKLREQVLSLIELRNVIYTRGTPPTDVGIKRVVVVSDGNSQVGIVVDKLIGETEIVIKSLSYHFFNVKGISGVTILGDGQLALILDPKLIIMESR